MDTLTRSVPFTLTRSDSRGDGLTLSGYASVFNQPTLIRGEGPDYEEIIAPGAFAKTIKERTPVLMFEHGQHPLIGSMPIGQIHTIREDRRGLYIEARLHDNWMVQPVRDAMESGAVTGMSFRFSVPKDKSTVDRSGEVPLVTRHEVKCPELGPVVFPAYEGAQAGVRSMIAALDDQTRAEIVEAFRAMADPDAAEDNEALQVVDQIKPLLGRLIELEGQSIQVGDDEVYDLQLLVSALCNLSCYEDLTEAELGLPEDDGGDPPMSGMNSADPDTHLEAAADHGTSDDESSRTDAEPLPDGTPQPNSLYEAQLTLLRLKRTA